LVEGFNSPLQFELPLVETPKTITVFFFCSKEGHDPVCYQNGRIYECHYCPKNPKGSKKSWFFFCWLCKIEGQDYCHYAAKHINSHANNIHGVKSIERFFAASNTAVCDHINEYKLNIGDKKRRKPKHQRTETTLPVPNAAEAAHPSKEPIDVVDSQADELADETSPIANGPSFCVPTNCQQFLPSPDRPIASQSLLQSGRRREGSYLIAVAAPLRKQFC